MSRPDMRVEVGTIAGVTVECKRLALPTIARATMFGRGCGGSSMRNTRSMSSER
jgi:hypothetical protein